MKILEKPVHAVLIRPTEVEKLASQGRLPASVKVKLPQEKSKAKTNLVTYQKVNNIAKQASLRAKLTVLHDQVPPLPQDKIPPCDSCIAACCYAFIVSITELEYNSGVYGDMAIKITPEMSQQLKSVGKFLPTSMFVIDPDNEPRYMLEGHVGEPCPFLTEDAKCSIYEHRPLTCRVYTCVGDSRITAGMRSGEEPIFSIMGETDVTKV